MLLLVVPASDPVCRHTTWQPQHSNQLHAACAMVQLQKQQEAMHQTAVSAAAAAPRGRAGWQSACWVSLATTRVSHRRKPAHPGWEGFCCNTSSQNLGHQRCRR